MQIKGDNLLLVCHALSGAMDEVQMQIGSCPDVVYYADHLEELEADKARYEKLRKRVIKAINREGKYRIDDSGQEPGN